MNKTNDIKVDGNGNIIVQDVSGETITINYNDTEVLKKLLSNITDTQSFELKQLLGNQHKEVLIEIRKLQNIIDEQQLEEQTKDFKVDNDDFLRDMKLKKHEDIKKRILTNYRLFREYEELLILEDDPIRKMRHENHINELNNKINNLEKGLK